MDNDKKSMIKNRGKVYTPTHIVTKILDLVGYSDMNIVGKNIIDNSCGDGRFLKEIVKRYCAECIKLGKSNKEIKFLLETNVYGIEIDEEETKKCINNLNKIIQDFKLKVEINWNIICADTLKVSKKYYGKMDYVVGNPPYVRIHNIKDINLLKKYLFCQKGMTDLYIPFFEIGINMLNKNGRLGYITPNSYFNSNAAKYMRMFFVKEKLLSKIVDYKHKQLFDATTYTAITILDRNNKLEHVEYFESDMQNSIRKIDDLIYKQCYINDSFYFADKNDLCLLEKIKNFKNGYFKIEVKNGYATLADKIFIGNFSYLNYCIPIIKASTGMKYNCIFPYINGELISEDILKKAKDVYRYLKKNIELLQKRSLDKNTNWYGFGRSQGISDTYKDKYSINTLVREQSDIKLIKCPKGVGVYSGLYIIADIDESILRKLIINEDFIKYISLLGKYKSGGYYTYSSKELKQFIEYKCCERFGCKNE